jgi:hypothetical protein
MRRNESAPAADSTRPAGAFLKGDAAGAYCPAIMAITALTKIAVAITFCGFVLKKDIVFLPFTDRTCKKHRLSPERQESPISLA